MNAAVQIVHHAVIHGTPVIVMSRTWQQRARQDVGQDLRTRLMFQESNMKLDEGPEFACFLSLKVIRLYQDPRGR